MQCAYRARQHAATATLVAHLGVRSTVQLVVQNGPLGALSATSNPHPRHGVLPQMKAMTWQQCGGGSRVAQASASYVEVFLSMFCFTRAELLHKMHAHFCFPLICARMQQLCKHGPKGDTAFGLYSALGYIACSPYLIASGSQAFSRWPTAHVCSSKLEC